MSVTQTVDMVPEVVGDVDADELGEEHGSALESLRRRLTRPIAALLAIPNIGTWCGVLLTAIGVGLLTLAWGRTAGLTEVGLQIPYLISAGFTGLALVAVGLSIVSISAKRADAQARSQQIAELRELLVELRNTIEPTP